MSYVEQGFLKADWGALLMSGLVVIPSTPLAAGTVLNSATPILVSGGYQ